MVLKSELEDWLKHPVTQDFQQALEAECEKSKQDLANEIDNNDLSKDDLFGSVLISKSVRATYQQFFGENSAETIIDMLDDHSLLVTEEDQDD